MNRETQRPTAHTPRAPHAAARARPSARHRLGEAARGVLFAGAAFLLGSCPLLFGAAPLGLALLAAASSYTLYILGGLVLAAFTSSILPGGWGWVGVYLFCLCLRLLVRFYVNPPTERDRRTVRMGSYLIQCVRSVARCFVLTDEPAGEASDAYYDGTHTTTDAGTSPRRAEDSTTHTSPLPAEHPFLRMLSAAVAGFAAGFVAWIVGGFRVYDLLALLVYIPVTPFLCGVFISCFGEAGLSLLFSPAPLATVRRQAATGSATNGRSASDARNEDPRWGGAYARLSMLAERLESTFGEDGGLTGGPRAAREASARGLGRMSTCYPLLPILSVATWLFFVVFAARGFRITLLGAYLLLPLAGLLALLLTLLCAARFGVLPGAVGAILFGLAAEARLIPVLLITTVVYSLLRGLSHRAGVIGGCTAGAAYSAMAEGVVALGGRLPMLVLAIPLYLVAERLWAGIPHEAITHDDPAAEELNARVSAALSAEARSKAQRARLEALSDALGVLSHRFSKLSGRLRQPRLSELRRLTADALAERCAHCRVRESCHAHREQLTGRLSEHLAAVLHRHGRLDAQDLPDELYDLCPYLEELCEDIRVRYQKLREALLHSERTDVCAADYAAMAELLSDALAEDAPNAAATEENKLTADRIFDYLSTEGVRVQGVVVAGARAGHRRVIVQGLGMDSLRADLTATRARMEALCGARLSLPAFETEGEGGVTVMTLAPEASLEVRYAGSTVPAGTAPDEVLPDPLTDRTPPAGYAPPAVCGDHIALFRTEEACFYALISDGMGSGEDASLTSDICAMFLERMLSAGGRVEVSLKMLDNYICAKNTGTRDECSATVDLMELDLADGQAVFAKSGAAPTYVVREGTVYKLRSRTMPLGILKGNDPRLLRFRMHPGDVVVMVSDGVTLGNDDCPWLIDLLSSPLPTSMDTLRADIIRRALSAGSEDDLSAIAIRVEEAE